MSAWLKVETSRPRKQKRTLKQLHADLIALGFDGSYTVRLIPPAYVKPFVKRQKNDATDAEAICEAVTRPSMRFAPIKNAEQQGVLVVHRTRDLLIRQRTMLANAFQAHLAEFGVVEKLGSASADNLIAQIEADAIDVVSSSRRAVRFDRRRIGVRCIHVVSHLEDERAELLPIAWTISGAI